MAFDSDYLFSMLARLDISTATVEHESLRTVEDAKRLTGHIEGGHVKNLFLKDKKKRYWMLVMLEDAAVDLKQAASLLGAQRFSFASSHELHELLGIIPGAVSPFALINDTEGRVQLVLDAAMMQVSPLNFHPLRNDRTTTITTANFLKFLSAIEHEPKILSLPASVKAATLLGT